MRRPLPVTGTDARDIPDLVRDYATDRFRTVFRTITNSIEVIRGERLGEIGLFVIGVILIISLISPLITPYDPNARHYDADDNLKRLEPPSQTHLLGTTQYGRDVFSQLLIGSRAAVIVGFVTASMIALIGTFAGLIAGYYEGWIDEVIMRFVDILYSIPTLPFAVILLVFIDRSVYAIITMLGLIYWRTCARVVRSEVLSLKTNEFVQAAKTQGGSSLRIIYVQLLPNVLPLSLLYFTIGAAWAIVLTASITFLGFGDPDRISWGRMVYEAWNSGSIRDQPYWAAAPAVMISLIVTSIFLVGKTYEKIANPQLQKRGR